MLLCCLSTSTILYPSLQECGSAHWLQSTSPVPLSLTEDMPSHAEEDSGPGRPYRQNEAPALPQPSCHGAVHVPGRLPGTNLACSALESLACYPATFKLGLRPSASILGFRQRSTGAFNTPASVICVICLQVTEEDSRPYHYGGRDDEVLWRGLLVRLTNHYSKAQLLCAANRSGCSHLLHSACARLLHA